MQPISVPEAIVTRFRTLSLDRIARVESVWGALVHGAVDEEAVRSASRDLHTLKGDASIIGFGDVEALARKLEELFSVAGALQYRIPHELDAVFGRALQLAAALVRDEPGSAIPVDLEQLTSQIDDLLRATGPQP